MEWSLGLDHCEFGLIWGLTLNHALISVIAIVVGFVIALPLGWVANRWGASRSFIVGAGSLLYTIPSVPLFVILPYVLGTRITDPANVEVALSIYAVAMMVRSSSDALASVSVDAIDAATSLGHSAWTRFWEVELPLAGPVLLAGLRVVSASTVALVSVGALVGSANLGFLFTDGRQRQFLEEILVGVVASLIVALVFDAVLVTIGRILMPWSRRIKRGRTEPSLFLVERGGLTMQFFFSAIAWLFDPANYVPGSQTPLPIQARVVEHLLYTGISVAIASVIALPLGFYIGHTGRGRQFVIALSGSLRALPALGLLGVVFVIVGMTVPFTQTAFIASIIAFVVLAIPSILAGAYAGVESVDPEMVDAGRAMGMTELQVLFRVEIPLSLPLTIGGIRSAVLQVIATVVIASYISLGGIGAIISTGISLNNNDEILGGAILVTVMALVIDSIFALAQRLTRRGGTVPARRNLRNIRSLPSRQRAMAEASTKERHS